MLNKIKTKKTKVLLIVLFISIWLLSIFGYGYLEILKNKYEDLNYLKSTIENFKDNTYKNEDTKLVISLKESNVTSKKDTVLTFKNINEIESLLNFIELQKEDGIINNHEFEIILSEIKKHKSPE